MHIIKIKWFIRSISQLDQLDQSVLSVPLVSSVPLAPLVPSARCHWPHRSHRSHWLHRPAATQVKPNCNLNFSSRTGPIDFKVWSQAESVPSARFGPLRSDLDLTTLFTVRKFYAILRSEYYESLRFVSFYTILRSEYYESLRFVSFTRYYGRNITKVYGS